MTEAGQLDRRVTFRQKALVGASRTGDWEDVLSRDARIQPKLGGEAVQAERMAGRQPVIITVRRDSLTKTIDNSWSAKDARDAGVYFDIQSKIVTEDLAWVEFLAVQRLPAGDEGEDE